MTPPGIDPIGDYYERQAARAILLEPSSLPDLQVAIRFLRDDLGCAATEVGSLDEAINGFAEDGLRVYRQAMAQAELTGKRHLTAHPGSHTQTSYLQTAMIDEALAPRLELNDAQRLAVRYAPRFVVLVNDLRYPPDDP